MAGNKGSGRSADERRARNLASANLSRQRRKERMASMTDDKARVNESNEILRTRAELRPSGAAPAKRDGSSSRGGGTELGPAMQRLMRTKDISDEAALDLLNRAISGGRGRGPPVDRGVNSKWSEGVKQAPKDLPRPLTLTDPPRPKGNPGKSKNKNKPPKASSSKTR